MITLNEKQKIILYYTKDNISEDIEGYCTGKDAFVKQLEKDALLWYQNNESYKTR